MGKEAITLACVGPESGEVKALLESSELILRGAIKRLLPKSTITDVQVRHRGGRSGSRPPDGGGPVDLARLPQGRGHSLW